MRPHQSLPRLWLMTDERIGEALWPALARLPRGAGVVFRHYRTGAAERRRLYGRVRAITRRRGLVLVLAGTPGEAMAWRADGAHGRWRQRCAGRLLHTAPAYDVREATRAARAGADLVFVSPVFATRSHPGGRALGIVGFGRIARHLTPSFPRRCNSSGLGRMRAHAGMTSSIAIALGGVDERRFRRLRPLGAYGWGAIDALTDQKRKVVPR